MPPKFTGESVSDQLILDYDVETLATGFADPNWVPQAITVVAWSWYGSDEVEVSSVIDFNHGPMPHLDPSAQRQMLFPFLEDLKKADVVRFHNGKRFDHPIVNGACWVANLPPIEAIKVQDTMNFGKVKGIKKGQDNIGELLGIPLHKLSLNHYQWLEAYLESGWPTVKERCVTDVMQHKLIAIEMEYRGWLKPPTL